MAQRRWTVMLVPHSEGASRSLSVSVTVLKFVAGIATVVAASALAAIVGVASHGVDITKARQLEHTNRVLAGEVQRLDLRLVELSDTLALISRRDEEVRRVAGLDPLDPDVRRAGIGGPSGAWAERELLLSEGG